MTATVYFIGDPSTRHIKIGTSTNRPARMNQLRNEHKADLILIGEIKGERGVEQNIHHHLAEYRVKGEWFKDCPEVRRAVGKIICDGEFLTDYQQRVRLQEQTQKERDQPWTDMQATLSALWPLVDGIPQATLILEAAFYRYIRAYGRVIPFWSDGDPNPIIETAQTDVARVSAEIMSIVEMQRE